MWIGIIPLEKELVSPTKKVKVINTVGLDGSRWSLRQLRRLTRLSHLSDTSPAACDDNPLSVWKLATSELHKRLLVNDLRDLPPVSDSLGLRASNFHTRLMHRRITGSLVWRFVVATSSLL